MELLKREFLELLEKDVEFRYAVAGYLGLSEVLKRLDYLVEEQTKLREEQTKIWREIEALREEQTKIWREIEALREEQTKLREDFNKMREDFNEMLKVVKGLQDTVKGLQGTVKGLQDTVKGLQGTVKGLQEAVGELQEGQRRLETALGSLRDAMISGLGEVSKFAGLTFEEFVRKFLTASLRKTGEIPEYAELVRAKVGEEEINLFLEEPLIVGEATGYAESPDEILKLLRKAEAVKAKYSKEPRKILVILTARKEVVKEIKRIAEEEGVGLIVGKTID